MVVETYLYSVKEGSMKLSHIVDYETNEKRSKVIDTIYDVLDVIDGVEEDEWTTDILCRSLSTGFSE